MLTGPRALFLALVVIGWPSGSSPVNAEDGRWHSQAPEVAASNIRGTPASAHEKPVDVGLDRGPSPFWIWGAKDDNTYYLKTTFKGGSTAARFKASCDNQVSIFLNGKQIAAHDEWEVPLEVDVQKHVLPGQNELIAHVANQGGPAGFLFKLALKDRDGKSRYVVSDASWTAAARRESVGRSPVRLVAPLGQGPWGDPLRGPSTLAARRGIFDVLPGFRVERLFTVPRDELGSWVSLTFDEEA